MFNSKVAIVAMTAMMAGSTGCGFYMSNPPPFESSETYVSKSGDKEIDFTISDKDVAGFPSWKPGLPVLLSSDKAAEIAAKELPKYTNEPSAFELMDITISRVHAGGSPKDKWLYLISFVRESNHNQIRIPVTLEGKPIIGNMHMPDKSRRSD